MRMAVLRCDFIADKRRQHGIGFLLNSTRLPNLPNLPASENLRQILIKAPQKGLQLHFFPVTSLQSLWRRSGCWESMKNSSPSLSQHRCLLLSPGHPPPSPGSDQWPQEAAPVTSCCCLAGARRHNTPAAASCLYTRQEKKYFVNIGRKFYVYFKMFKLFQNNKSRYISRFLGYYSCCMFPTNIISMICVA